MLACRKPNARTAKVSAAALRGWATTTSLSTARRGYRRCRDFALSVRHGQRTDFAPNRIRAISRSRLARRPACTSRSNCTISMCRLAAMSLIPRSNPKFAHETRLPGRTHRAPSARPGTARAILVGDLNVAPLEARRLEPQAIVARSCHTPISVKSSPLSSAPAAGSTSPARSSGTRQALAPGELPRAGLGRGRQGRRLDHIWVSRAGRASFRGSRLRARHAVAGPSDHVPVGRRSKRNHPLQDCPASWPVTFRPFTQCGGFEVPIVLAALVLGTSNPTTLESYFTSVPILEVRHGGCRKVMRTSESDTSGEG